jgi:hypothetical protein
MGFTYYHLDEPGVRESMLALWEAENETLLADDRRAECYGADLIEPGYKPPRVNVQWATNLLCLGEFNIAYVRGLAEVLVEREETECVVYRAQDASEPRCECTDWEGQSFALRDVIEGHRARYWPPESADESAFSVPSGFNCHHSIRSA